jgi:hypothetical protein
MKTINIMMQNPPVRCESKMAEDRKVNRELGKRRVFLFAAAFLALALPGVIGEESDIFLHALDEYVILTLAVVAIVLIVVFRKKVSLAELRKQHNILLVLFIIALIFKINAIMVESADPSDFGDEIPIFILLVLTIVNRFL